MPNTTAAETPLLTITDLAVSFASRGGGGRARAVDGVSLTLYPNQTLAVVGESGSGKSVTALSILRLLPESARIERGSITLRENGAPTDLLGLPERAMRQVRGGRIAMIFQEPMTSLNPVYTIGDQIVEAVLLHQRVSPDEAEAIAAKALEEVGVADARNRLRDYPHQFSGGMRQRVMIAMALACAPRVLLADEPTTALDVTIQEQVLELLRRIRRDRGMGVLLITHALGVVAENADVVCVMYAGRVVEYATVYDLFDRPLHPYTRGLLKCLPGLHDRRARLTTVREVTDNEAEFARLAEEARGMRAWWPHHAPPQGASGSVLHEVAPGHWVNVWRTGEAGDPARRPDLAFRR